MNLPTFPSSWKSVRLGDVCDVDWGNTSLTKAEYQAHGYPAYSATGNDGYLNSYEHDGNAVVVSAIGARCGKCFFATGKWTAIKNTIVIKAKQQGFADEQFLFFLLNDGEKWPKSGSGQPFIGIGNAQQMELILPPFGEQKGIAQALHAVQKAKEARQRELALEHERQVGLMDYLFTYGTRGEPTKQTEIGEIPQGWELIQLGEIAKIGNGSTPKRSYENYWKNGTIPWITSTQIHDVVITQAHEFVTKTARNECHLPLVPSGSIVVAITGQGKTLGNAAILEIDACINQHLAYVRFDRPSVQAKFVLFYLQSKYRYLRAVSTAGGSTRGALTCGFLARMSIPVPPLDEQSTIANLLLVCEARCKCLDREITLLEELFRATLDELMTGRLSAIPLIEESVVS